MKNNLKHIKHSGFSTPKNYFKSVDKKILNQIKEDTVLNQVKNHGYNIPDNYFNHIDETIFKSISKKEPKTLKLPLFKKVVYISSIAASLLLAFTVFLNKNNHVTFDNLETTSIENYIENDISLQDLTNFITNEDLETNGFSEITFSEEHLENYILNNTSVEELILE